MAKMGGGKNQDPEIFNMIFEITGVITIAEAILDGKKGPIVTLARVLETFPVEWEKQSDHFGQSSGSSRS
jgi:hypothetical protein